MDDNTDTQEMIKLAAEDTELCRQFGQSLQLLRDRVRSVAARHHNGCYVVGQPGAGKTETVLSETKPSRRPLHGP